MRIGLSTSAIGRGQTGIAQYVFGLTRAFLEHTVQHQFTLFVMKEDLPLFQFVGDEMELVIVPEWFRSPIRNILWHQEWLPRLAQRHHLDVLHVPSYRRLPWPRPCALVATVHDLAPFHIPKKYDRKRMFYGRVVARQLIRRQDEVIAISQNTAQDIQTFYGLPSERLTVIHNGVDHSQFFPGSREAAQAEVADRYGIRQPFFLYVARLEHPGKNHVRLIEAFNRFKAETRSPWQLVLVGSNWHGADVIHSMLRRSPFAPDLFCLGFVEDSALPTLYRAAGVFCYPSLYEGFGLPPVEAMACGCPVLCSPRGALGEVVDGAAIIVDPENVTAIKEELTRLSTKQALREELRAAGLVRAQHFNWQRTAAATLSVYARAFTRVRQQHSAPVLAPELESWPQKDTVAMK